MLLFLSVRIVGVIWWFFYPCACSASAPSMGPSRDPKVTPSYLSVAAPVLYIATVLAGSSSLGSSEGGIATTAAVLGSLTRLWKRTGGATYVVDRGDSLVRFVTTNGIIQNLCAIWGMTNGDFYMTENAKMKKISSSGSFAEFAGIGAEGSFGDGEQASSASLDHPVHTVVDTSGSVYIADSGGYKIRKVSVGGIAGNGQFGFANGPTTSAGINMLSGLFLSSLGVFFGQRIGHCSVVKVSPCRCDIEALTHLLVPSNVVFGATHFWSCAVAVLSMCWRSSI